MAILLIILPASLHAQETDREQVLADDINRLGERALRDRIISEEEHTQMGGVYDIIMPGGRPDDSCRHAPKMAYDPHPDKHFRR